MDKEACELLLKRLEACDRDKFFARPIRQVLAREPRVLKRYLSEIAQPMDFFSVRKKLHADKYANRNSFLADVRLIFENARRFNAAASLVHRKATELLGELERALSGEINHAMAGTQGVDTEENTARQLEPVAGDYKHKRLQVPAFYLPLPKSARRNAYVTEVGLPLSYYQWDVEQTEDIVRVAGRAGIPLDQVTLPCFAFVGDDAAKIRQFMAKRRRPPREEENEHEEEEQDDEKLDDIAQFEPKSRKDQQLMQSVYNRIIGDQLERVLEKGDLGLLPSRCDDDWQPPDGCKILCTVKMPPEDFFLVFEDKCDLEERKKFLQTRRSGEPRMTVFVSTYAEMKLMIGVSAIRVQISGSNELFSLLREPLVLVLRGNEVTINACVDIISRGELPVEFARTGKPGRQPVIQEESVEMFLKT